MEPCTNAFESLINLPENLCFDYKESGSLLHASFCFCFLFLLIIHAVICLFQIFSSKSSVCSFCFNNNKRYHRLGIRVAWRKCERENGTSTILMDSLTFTKENIN